MLKILLKMRFMLSYRTHSTHSRLNWYHHTCLRIFYDYDSTTYLIRKNMSTLERIVSHENKDLSKAPNCHYYTQLISHILRKTLYKNNIKLALYNIYITQPSS